MFKLIIRLEGNRTITRHWKKLPAFIFHGQVEKMVHVWHCKLVYNRKTNNKTPIQDS